MLKLITTLMLVSIEVYLFLLILGIPMFFVWRWLLKKYFMTNKTRIIATWIATIISTPIIYIGIILLWIFSLSYYPSNDFDRENWISNKENRYELSENLIESKILIGMTKSEVRQLLGDEGNLDESDLWKYSLGYRPGFISIDPDVLDIEFNEGKVIKVSQHQT